MLERVFPGDSEMARRIRDFDWARTPLGPVDRWPQSLLTTVSTCLDCAFPIVLWWGPDLVILYNDEYRPMLGPEKHPVALGQPGALVWPEIWDVIAPMLSQVMDRGEATRSRDLLLHINRGYPEEAYFSFSYSPIHDEKGKVGGIFCPVIETTERVIGERRLRTLRDLAARCKGAENETVAYRATALILGANPYDVPFAMIYRIDEDESVARLTETAGIAPGTVASPRVVALERDVESVWSLSTVLHSGRAVVVTDLSRHFQAPPDHQPLPTGAWKRSPQSAMVLPVHLPGQDKPRAILIAAVSPMRALDDDYRTFFELVATQFAAGLADAQAIEAERRRAEALAAIDRAKTAFFSNVSHEFRTPLTLMLGPLDDLLANAHGVLPADAAETLTVAQRNGLRLLKLVNTLLDFSRIEAGRIEANYEPIDLAMFTAELASMFQSAIDRAGLRLIVDCPPLPDAVYVDRDMWEKVVLNLLSNAFKFTFEGEIEVALHARGDRVELSVRDTGVGIPDADRPRMFQRFYRVKNARARTHEGTGIGLAFVLELVRLHGGEVSFRSKEGVGTTFVVSIPSGSAHLPADRISAGRHLVSTSVGAKPFVEEALRWLPPSPDRATRAPGREMVSAPQHMPDLSAVSELADVFTPRRRSSTAPPARVLVADDNTDMREYLHRLLDHDYDVEVVADGETALQRIRANPPDLVLTDVMMPQRDGFGLLAAIRAEERTQSLPVIMLSARAGEEARIEGHHAGADAYLVKPFSARELLARIASQLELARLRREVERALRYRGEQYETLLNQMKESEELLREANRVKDEFLATLSHELRTPLNAILGWAQMLRDRVLSGEAEFRAVDTIAKNARMQAQLVDDLLDVSRIISGKLEMKSDVVDLGSVVQAAIETVRLAAAARQIELVAIMPDDPPLLVNGDADRLQQAAWNLLTNAIKFSSAGGRVEIVLRRNETGAEIEVKDQGQGIASEFLPHVFERFRQFDSSTTRKHGGLGLGLAIVRHVVEAHGGTVSAASAGEGQGATFLIGLPVVAASRETAARAHA